MQVHSAREGGAQTDTESEFYVYIFFPALRCKFYFITVNLLKSLVLVICQSPWISYTSMSSANKDRFIAAFPVFMFFFFNSSYTGQDRWYLNKIKYWCVVNVQ